MTDVKILSINRYYWVLLSLLLHVLFSMDYHDYTMFKGVILLTYGSKCSFFKGISLIGVISRLPLSSETLQREYCTSCAIYNLAF